MDDEPRLLDKCEVDALDAQGPLAAAYEAYGRWLYWWRERHPEDDRSDYDLVEEYGAWYATRPEWPYLERKRGST